MGFKILRVSWSWSGGNITVFFFLIPSQVMQAFYLVLYCECQFETISSFPVSPPSVVFLPSRSAHLPPSPAPHLPAHLTISTSPFQQSEKERGLNQLKGGGVVQQISRRKKGRTSNQQKKEEGVGRRSVWPREPPQIDPKSYSPPHHQGLVWGLKFDAGLNLNILFCIICPLDDADIKAI